MNSQFRQHLRERSGQALVEAIVALSVLTVGFFSILGFLIGAAGSTGRAVDQTAASFLAAEGLEIVKGAVERFRVIGDFNNFPRGCFEVDIKNGLGDDPANWPTIPGGGQCGQGRFSQTPLNFDGGFYDYDSGTATKFLRTIDVERASANSIRTRSIVQWNDKGGIRKEVSYEAYFYDY